jgi:uncharacterized membrane protein
MSNPEASAKSALGLDGNITALLCYIIGVIGLILAFIEKDNKFVRFHAWQSLLYGLAAGAVLIVIGFVLFILALIAGQVSAAFASIAGVLFILLFVVLVVLSLAVAIGALYAAYKGYQGEIFKLPIVGNFAEKMANK